jgi:hypothetical protein
MPSNSQAVARKEAQQLQQQRQQAYDIEEHEQQAKLGAQVRKVHSRGLIKCNSRIP